MKHAKANRAELLLIEVPEGIDDITICRSQDDYTIQQLQYPSDKFRGLQNYDSIDLPEGSWELLGLASEIPESVAAEVVDMYWRGETGLYNLYGAIPCGTASATRSLHSLIQSHSLTTSQTVVLKKK